MIKIRRFICVICCVLLTSCGIEPSQKAGMPTTDTVQEAMVNEDYPFTTSISPHVQTEQLPEQNKVYILKNGNPDPIPYYGGATFEFDSNNTYAQFGVTFDFKNTHFWVFCSQMNDELRDVMIYSYPSVEYLQSNGSWRRLPYLPEGIEIAENRWTPFRKVYIAGASLREERCIYFADIAAELATGEDCRYRVIMYISGKDASGAVKNLKYEVIFPLMALDPLYPIPE